MIDDPTNALHVARARVRVLELERHATALADQLRELDDLRAAVLAHVDQLEAGYRDHIGAVVS